MDIAALEPSQVALRLVGLFYAVAGYAGVRAALTSRLVDGAICAITLKKPRRTETLQAAWLMGAALAILAGGIALMLLLDVALALFALSAIGQTVYLHHLAPRYFDPVDPPASAGRRQSRNAFVIYLAATAFVAWAWLTGRLLASREVPWLLLALPGALVLGYAATAIRQFLRPLAPASGSADVAEVDRPERDPARSKSVKVMADYGCHPLWAMDEGVFGDIAPADLGLSEELGADLERWAADYASALDPDDPARAIWTAAQRAEHEVAGRRLAVRLARERPDLKVYHHTESEGAVEADGGAET